MTIYNYEKTANITSNYYPINTHLCVEYGSYIYFVPFQNTSTIRKLDPSDGTSSLIVTESGAITKFYLDRSGEKLYYYHEQSVFSYVDLTDDSITDLDDTLNAAEDLFIYDGSLFAVDTSQDDLTFYKYTAGAPGSWGAVGTIAEGKTNYYDIVTVSVGANSSPFGICWDGTYFYVTDSIDGYVYKYNAALDTLVASYNIGGLGGNDSPYGICWDGTYFYVTDSDDYVYKYPSDFSSLIDSFDISALGATTPLEGMEWDGTYFYITDLNDGVHKIASDFSEIIETFNINAIKPGANCYPIGICWDGTYFYIVDNYDDSINKFNSDFSLLLDIYDIGSLGGNDNPDSLCWDGVYFYVIDSTDAYVYKYLSDLVTELGSILYTAVIGDNAYVVYQYITGDVKIYVKDLTDSTNPVLLETISSNYIIPYSENQRGVSVSSDNDTLYFVLKNKTDGLTYLCTYAITGDTFTVKGQYSIALMLDRNTNSSNNPPFNLEKGFHLTSLYIYQIASSKSNLYKIADLTNNSDFSSHIIKGITDTYLITSDGSSSQISTDQDFSNYIIEPLIYHPERSYPTAELTYRADKLYLEDGMFLQMIGNIRVNGVTSVGVRFEGYIIAPEDEEEESIFIKKVDLINPIYYDLKRSFKGTLSAGSGDDWLDTIDDDFEYGSKGTYDAGTLSLPEITRNSGKDIQQFIDQLALGEGFTWRIRPTGELDWTAGDDDSGLDYDQSTPIWDVLVKKKKIRPNSITVTGAYVNGALIESESDHGQDLADQQQYGIIPLEVPVSWLTTVSLCNSYADAILAIINQEYIEVQFKVKDETNGFVPPGEEITLADSNKGITSAQFKINQVIYDDKTNIAEYTVSSIVRWDEDDLRFGFEQELSDQVDQLAGSVNTNITDIGTNTSDIDTNTSDISTNTGNISTIQSGNNVGRHIGAGNAGWRTLPCCDLSVSSRWRDSGGFYSQVDAASALSWEVDLEPTRYGKKLYLNTLRLGVYAANSNNKITNVYINGINYDGATAILSDATARTAQGEYDYDLSDYDCSSFDRIVIYISTAYNADNALQIAFAKTEYYYDD